MKISKLKFLLCTFIALTAEAVCAQATGTGFYVNNEGYIATNYHVIEGSTVIQIRNANNELIDASVVATDRSNDLAILKTKTGSKPHISVANSDGVKKGDKVFTLGFPNISIQGQAIKFTDGAISALTGIMDQPNTFQISVPVQPGNSGGPLIDSNGNAIGVVVAKLSARAMLQTSGTLPENINYAVKSNYLRELLRAHKIPSPPNNSIKGRDKSFTDLASNLEDAVVLIIATNPKRSSKGVSSVDERGSDRPASIVRIAVLPPSLPRNEKGMFESDAESFKKFKKFAIDFAQQNKIDHIVFEGGAYVKSTSELQKTELINKAAINGDRYLNPRIFFIDATQAIRETGRSFQELDPIFFEFSKIIKADIVLHTAVYSSERANITSDFAAYVKIKNEPVQDRFESGLKIKLINNGVIFSSKYYRKLLSQYGVQAANPIFFKRANELISSYAKTNGIDLVLQSDNPINGDLDMTVEIIRALDSAE